MIVKCRNKEFNLDKDDEIMYNGTCYQIVTKVYINGFSKCIPVIANAKAKKLIKDEILVFCRKEKSNYGGELMYYKLKENYSQPLINLKRR